PDGGAAIMGCSSFRGRVMANRHEDDDEFLDVEAASYQPLTAVDPELDRRLRHTYVSLFLSESELSERRYGQAYEMLSISRGILPDGRRLLRVDFPFMGSTSWREWDGTEEEALASIHEEARARAYDVGFDQAHGPTGWETEFDEETT
ncbi:MAG: hypothetical protein M3203_04165, partial [Actinomycetota bacterium]|nr:hypothetical protein [Actinomycetota bacterium]